MKYAGWILFFLLSMALNATPILINEFNPNPYGPDANSQIIEFSGLAHSETNHLSFFAIEADNAASKGKIDFLLHDFSLHFNELGLATLTIPDLENPSFSLFLSVSTSFVLGQDIDANNDGFWDDTWDGYLDSISIFDAAKDQRNTHYASQLGGTDFFYTGTEPYLAFRDSVNNDWYALNDPSDEMVFSSSGQRYHVNEFNLVPSLSTFEVTNPSRINQVSEPKLLVLWLILWFIWYLRR